LLYLALGALALAFVLWTRGTKVFKGRGWRFLSSAAAIVAFAGAAFAAIREAWVPAAVLLVFGMWLAVSTRRNAPTAPRAAPSREMSLSEARSLLGVEAGATPAQIKAAYSRLMRMAHPDKGGTAGLAAQLNAARDRLLKG
jgi:DnaJ-domain-containing protein 1